MGTRSRHAVILFIAYHLVEQIQKNKSFYYLLSSVVIFLYGDHTWNTIRKINK